MAVLARQSHQNDTAADRTHDVDIPAAETVAGENRFGRKLFDDSIQHPVQQFRICTGFQFGF